MRIFGLNEITRDVEGSETSIGADVADLENEEQVEDSTPSGPDEVEEDPEEETTETPLEDESQETRPEEVDQIIHPFDRPSIKQLSEAYPDLFKKFPSLRDMYFREAEFTKVFPTIDDAKEANENNTAFLNIKNDIFTGDGTKFISAIKEVDNGKGLDKFAGNFLTSLYKSSPDSFFKAANPLIENVAQQMFQKGARENDENLQNSARYLSIFFLGDKEFAEGKKTSIPKVEEVSEVSREREAWDNEKHQTFSNGVSNDLSIQLNALVIGHDQKTGKSRIDPDGVLSDFIKDTIIERVKRDIGNQLQEDKAHLRFMDSLWDRAKKNGRTNADKSSIISAYLARAKQMIPSLRSKYVSEAQNKRAKDASQRRERVSQVSQNGGSLGRPSGAKSGYNPKTIDYRNTSDEDILNDNISYRK